MGLNRRRIYSTSQTTLAPSRLLWLQAKLTISLTSIQDKFAKLFMTIAAELWLRGTYRDLEAVFQAATRNFTIRLAEKLAKYLCSLMRRAETLATPERNTFSTPRAGFRSILSELIGAATENANVNRDRAPSGPVKVVVFFFSSGMADHALRLGPYMRRSCK